MRVSVKLERLDKPRLVRMMHVKASTCHNPPNTSTDPRCIKAVYYNDYSTRRSEAEYRMIDTLAEIRTYCEAARDRYSAIWAGQ